MALQDRSPSRDRRGWDLGKARLVHHSHRSEACPGEGLAHLMIGHYIVAAAEDRLDMG